jgi:hypothetical protein
LGLYCASSLIKKDLDKADAAVTELVHFLLVKVIASSHLMKRKMDTR